MNFLNNFMRYLKFLILLHDHFEGCIEIANHKGVIFIPRGEAPRDEEMTPEGLAISMHPEK